MKRKFIRYGLALVGVLSLTLGGALPAVGTEPDPTSISSEGEPTLPPNLDEIMNAGIPEEGYSTGPQVLEISGSANGVARGPGIGTGSYTVTCVATMEDPHYSEKAGGAIFKTRASCTGTGSYPALVQMRIKGLLQLDHAEYPTETSPSIFVTKATSDEIQSITVNGTTITYYTPLVGNNGGFGRGFWATTITGQIVWPQVSVWTASNTNILFTAVIP